MVSNEGHVVSSLTGTASPLLFRLMVSVANSDFDFHVDSIDVRGELWKSAPISKHSELNVFGLPVGPPGFGDIVFRGTPDSAEAFQEEARHGLEDIGERRFAELHRAESSTTCLKFMIGESFLEYLDGDMRFPRRETAWLVRRSFGQIACLDEGPELRTALQLDLYFGLLVTPPCASPSALYQNLTPLRLSTQLAAVDDREAADSVELSTSQLQLYLVEPQGPVDPEARTSATAKIRVSHIQMASQGDI